ncbi:MAG: hypothetical protein ACUVV4_08435 [Candidatus Bathyarchaeia archaeon]
MGSNPIPGAYSSGSNLSLLNTTKPYLMKYNATFTTITAGSAATPERSEPSTTAI